MKTNKNIWENVGRDYGERHIRITCESIYITSQIHKNTGRALFLPENASLVGIIFSMGFPKVITNNVGP